MTEKTRFDGGIPFEKTLTPQYQKVMKELRKYYGDKVVLKTYEIAMLRKENALKRLSLHNPVWQSVDEVKTIIVAEFAMMIHPLIAGGMIAIEIVRELGRFEDYLEKRLKPEALEEMWRGAAILQTMKNERGWWMNND